MPYLFVLPGVVVGTVPRLSRSIRQLFRTTKGASLVLLCQALLAAIGLLVSIAIAYLLGDPSTASTAFSFTDLPTLLFLAFPVTFLVTTLIANRLLNSHRWGFVGFALVCAVPLGWGWFNGVLQLALLAKIGLG